MLYNNINNNNINTENTIPGSFGTNDNSMPGSFSQDDTTNTQYQQHGQSNLNEQPLGGSHNIQSGTLNHGNHIDNNNVNNNNLTPNHGEINNLQNSTDVNNNLQNNQDSTNSLESQDGHRVLMSHHKGLHRNNNNDQEHHYGRDAGAAGLAQHEYKEHENKNTDPLNTSRTDGLHNRNQSLVTGSHDNASNQHHYSRNAALGAAGAGLAHHEHKEHENKNVDPLNASRTDGLHNNESSLPGSHDNNNQHHYGRNAALGTAGAGLAHHEYKEHEHKNADPLNASHTDGLHNNQSSLPDSHNDSDQHHYGRDAALAGTAAGAAGLAHHEHKENENKNADPLNAPQGEGIHDNQSSLSGSHGINKDHHYGRDAALAGGAAGAAGLAHHEHKEHENKKDSIASDATTSNATAAEGDNHGSAGADGEHKSKPKNTGGDVHHIAEQPMITMHGGLTGKQPVGEVSFKKL